MKRNIYFIVGVVALVISSFLIGLKLYNRSQRMAEEQKVGTLDTSRLVREDSASQGPAMARVSVVEFLDPQCESCRMMAPVVRQILKEYEGRIHYVVRYMPFHPNSIEAATAIEAAGQQGKFWEALELLFEKQPEWAAHESPKPELITGYMKSLGLDMKLFENSLKDPKHKEKIERDKQDGSYFGVTGTPTFFVNEHMLDQLGYEPLKQAIEDSTKN